MTVVFDTRCPLCDTEGWATFAKLDGFMGICGTAWGGPLLEPRQSEQCRIIAALRWEVTFLQLLSGEVAA